MQDHSLNHIADLIENCISLQEISSNPRLVSFLMYYGYLPLQELITNLKNIKIDLDAAVQACLASNYLNRFLIVQPIPILYVPYQVFPATLILSNVPIKSDLDKLKAFIREISGTDEFDIEKNQDEEDIPTYSLTFKAIDTSMYFWRALKYVPFDNTFITVLPKIIKINQTFQKNNQTSKNYKSHRSKNNRQNYNFKKNRQSSSSDNDNYTYNNKYRSHNSQACEVTLKKDYIRKTPTIKIETPNLSTSDK